MESRVAYFPTKDAVMMGLIDEFSANSVRCRMLLQASHERAGTADSKRDMLPDAVIDPSLEPWRCVPG